MKELRFREVNVLLTVTEPVSDRDVAIATDPHWFVCIYSIASKLASTSWSVVENTNFGVRSGWL